ncbi:MAG: OmpH family outer membrane protein [Deltaproteobacteria bacterium]|nr:OmpH family outer membrane protein [Deltaproteobacteria bacterium]
MKHLLRFTIVMLIMFFFQYNAMGAGTSKIGVVDIQKFQQKSRKFQKTSEGLKKKYDAMKQKLEKERTALRALEEEFRKQSMMLSFDAKEGKKRELDKKARYFKYLYDNYTQEMKYAEEETTKRIGKELGGIVKKIGEKQGYILIFKKRTPGLIYFSDAIDISDQVIEEYDRIKK